MDTVTNVNGGTYSASYDADGNMVVRNGYTVQWTAANLPSAIAGATGTSSFDYGPAGNRYYQAASFNGVTTDTTYIGSLFEVVSNSTTTEYRHNILADGQIVAVHTIDQSGSVYTDYLHYDHLGSVDAITGDSGSVIQTMSFDAFGLRRDPTNWNYDLGQTTIATLKNYTDRGYTDQEQLDNLSLVDLNGRVYDPTVGRFLSADPTAGSGPYRYSYVGNNPLAWSDPSGFIDSVPDCTQEQMNNGDTRHCALPLVPITVTGFAIPSIQLVDPSFLNLLVPGWGHGSYLPWLPNPLLPGVASSNSKQPKQGKSLLCSAANHSEQGIAVLLAFTNANSNGKAIPGASHTFVMAIDPGDLAMYASRAGPGSGPGGGPGVGSLRIIAVSGQYSSTFPDYGDVTAVQMVGYLNASYSQVTGYMNSFAANVNADDLYYGGVIQNSNSYSDALISGMGFTPPNPVRWAPGYGTDSPDSQMQCTRP